MEDPPAPEVLLKTIFFAVAPNYQILYDWQMWLPESNADLFCSVPPLPREIPEQRAC